jgi:hypothetical protein
MATSIFNDINHLTIMFSYSPEAGKTIMNILIDTNPRVPGQAVMHEEVALMYRGMPSDLRKMLKAELAHFMDGEDE